MHSSIPLQWLHGAELLILLKLNRLLVVIALILLVVRIVLGSLLRVFAHDKLMIQLLAPIVTVPAAITVLTHYNCS